MREKKIEEELKVYGTMRRKFIIKGREKRKAVKLLNLHGITATKHNGEYIVKMPQKRSRMALLLLDRNCEYNKKLEEKRRGPYTIDKYYDVEVIAT